VIVIGYAAIVQETKLTASPVEFQVRMTLCRESASERIGAAGCVAAIQGNARTEEGSAGDFVAAEWPASLFFSQDSSMMPADYARLLQDRPMPAAFADLDAIGANLRALETRAAGKPIRIATKSVRCRELLHWLTQQSGQLRGWMTFSAAETLFLADAGFDDFLLAYPQVNPAELRQLAQLSKAGITLRLMADLPAHLARLEDAAAAVGTVLHVCLDLDLSMRLPVLHFGVRRSALWRPSQVRAFAQEALRYPHLKLDALMGYEAQIAGLGDRVPGAGMKNPVIRALKRRSVRDIARRRAEAVRILTEVAGPPALVNGGGTGSLESTREEAAVTEVTAGSGLYSSGLFDYYDTFRHQPAAGFALAVTRCPAPGIWTCHGGGYIASGAAGIDKQPTPWWPPGARLLPAEGAGEVQTPIAYAGPEPLGIGDPVLMRHAKAGELCERFNELLLIQGGAVTGAVPTYRGEGKAFL